MDEQENKETNTLEQEQEGSVGCGCLILISAFALVVFAFNSCVRYVNDQVQEDVKPIQQSTEIKEANPNIINEKAFKGKWALTVPKTYIQCVKIGSLTGATVNVDGVEYAITRNVQHKDFLPAKYWKDAPFEKIDQYNVCSDVPIGSGCKTSLSDMIEYADTLCK